MAEEAAGDVAKEAAPQTPAVVFAEQINLVEFAGKVWRVGVMGESCNRDYVKAFFDATDRLL